MRQSFTNKRILLTGGANGIGRCLAELLAKDRATLILTDIDEAALARTEQELAHFGADIHTRQVNVADRSAVEDMAAWVEHEFGGLDILINNAGIGHNGEFVETPIDKWKQLVDVNFWGPLYHVYALLPMMVEAGSGQIVNVSSGQAFFRLPTWGPYAVIKLALGGFSEMLRHEVKKFGVHVTTVYPFMVDTGFYKDIEGETFGAKLSMKLVPYYSMKPARVAKIMYKAIKRKKAVEMVSVLNDVAFYMRTTPLVPDMVSTIALKFLGKSAKDLKPELDAAMVEALEEVRHVAS